MWEKLWRFILPKILQAGADPSRVTESHSAATCQLHIFFFLPMTLAWGVETILWLWKIREPLKAPNLLIDYTWLSWWSWSILKNRHNGTSPIFRRRLRQSRSQGGWSFWHPYDLIMGLPKNRTPQIQGLPFSLFKLPWKSHVQTHLGWYIVASYMSHCTYS